MQYLRHPNRASSATRKTTFLAAIFAIAACDQQRFDVAVTCAILTDSTFTPNAIPFDSIGAVMELSDASLVVVNAKASEISLVRWNPNTVSRLVGKGRGPNEVTAPGALLKVNSSAVELFDISERRFITIDSSGRVGSGRRWLGGRSGMSVLFQPTPFATDLRGNVFAYAIADFRLREFVSVLRCSALTEIPCDTAAMLPVRMMQVPHKKTAMKSKFVVGELFTNGVFTVNVSGRVFIFSASDLGVYSPTDGGEWIKVATLPVVKTAVTEGEWERIVAKDSVLTQQVINSGLETARSQGLNPAKIPLELRTFQRSDEQPEWFPPFTDRPPLNGADGSVFIERGHAEGAVHVVTVLSRDLSLGCIQIPISTRLVGVGRQYLYTARVSDDGMEFVQRHHWSRH